MNENVGLPVRVSRDEIGCGRVERHVASIGADGGVLAVATDRLAAAGGHAHPLGGPGLPVVDEGVNVAVRVTGDEVGGIRVERHVASVGTDGMSVAIASRLAAVGGHAHPLGGPCLPVMDESVSVAVRVTGDEAGGIRVERHVASVGSDGGSIAISGHLAAAGGHAHPLGDPGLPVVDKDVAVTVRVAGDEVGGVRVERHIASVGTDGRIVTVATGRLAAVRGHAHPLGGPGLRVVDESVGLTVRVS